MEKALLGSTLMELKDKSLHHQTNMYVREGLRDRFITPYLALTTILA